MCPDFTASLCYMDSLVFHTTYKIVEWTYVPRDGKIGLQTCELEIEKCGFWQIPEKGSSSRTSNNSNFPNITLNNHKETKDLGEMMCPLYFSVAAQR